MRRADDGKLFAVQAVAFARGVGFLVGVAGAEPPANGLLRFGGEGRSAAVAALRKLAESGLWRDPGENTQRRAEGFNRLALAAWS